MKTINLWAAIVLSFTYCLSCQASDILTLLNQKSFEGKVVKIQDCIVTFKHEEGKFRVPSDDIYSLQFEDASDPCYLKMVCDDNSSLDPCLKGSLDAQNLHGREVKNFALGVLFGPFAILGANLVNPKPQKGKDVDRSTNKESFDDPLYLYCYRKHARRRNTIWAGVGTLVTHLVVFPTLRNVLS